MKTKDKRSYRSKGLEFSNLNFMTQAEYRYVSANIKRISEKIKTKRKELGLSQEELSEKLSISVSTIKFIEQNQRSPSLPMLFKILYVLDKDGLVWF